MPNYDLKDLAYRQFAEKIMGEAEATNVSAQTMVGACLVILRGLYSVLPPDLKRDYCYNLQRFVKEMEAHDATAVM